MNFIKNLFKKAFAFAVNSFRKGVDLAASLIEPLIMRFAGKTVSMPTLAEVGKAALGLAVAVSLGMIMNIVGVLVLTLITTALALVLPLLIANLIGCVLTVALIVTFYLQVFERDFECTVEFSKA